MKKPPSPPPPKKPKNPDPRRRGGRPPGHHTKHKKTIYKETLEKLKADYKAYEAMIDHMDDRGFPRDKFGNLIGPYYGETPLEFMLNVMRDPKAPTRFRFQAAKEAAPYQHPKLASIEVKSKNLNVNAEKGKRNNLTADEALQIYKDLVDG